MTPGRPQAGAEPDHDLIPQWAKWAGHLGGCPLEFGGCPKAGCMGYLSFHLYWSQSSHTRLVAMHLGSLLGRGDGEAGREPDACRHTTGHPD